MRKTTTRNTGLGLLEGLLAGAVATWAMGKVTSALYAREDRTARAREDGARGGRTAYAVAAGKTARLAGATLSDEASERWGGRLHWALGIGTAGLYGALRAREPALGAAHGVLFGLAFWLLVDELANPLLGFTPGPRAFPWQAHARGLAGHLAYGVTTAAALDAMERVA
ncbi:MAG TPA: DUF1440 domain-containing protein [Gemmatimonadales bacterium]|nr:DUF1440 domain-containing protein [Gemmatimonadales bacterium]